MTTPSQQDAAWMFYPFNPCGHLALLDVPNPGGTRMTRPSMRPPKSRIKLSLLSGGAAAMVSTPGPPDAQGSAAS